MQKYNPRIFIISAVHNSLEHTKELLEALSKQTYSNYQTIIIDDGSTDGTKEYVKKNYPKIKVLQGSGQLWWTGALYKGVEYVLKKVSKKDFILTINNDCVVKKDYLSTILSIAQQNKDSIIGSLVVEKDNPKEILDAGVIINWKSGEFEKLKKEKNIKVQNKINILSTKGTLYPVQVFRKIGNFDKKHFPHYASDYEFACRIQRAGFKLHLSYESIIYNDSKRTGFGTKQKREDLIIKNIFSLLFSRKSQVNIIDQINFIRFCAPPKKKLKNYYFLFRRLAKRLFNY